MSLVILKQAVEIWINEKNIQT